MFPDITLRRESGGWCPVQCPFHHDRTASASFNPTTQRFKCHTCGVGGDGYDLIQEHDRCDLATARAKAADICGGNFVVAESEPSGRSRLTSRRALSRSRLVRKRR